MIDFEEIERGEKMSQKFYVICYRLPEKEAIFFRGDNRYTIYLPSLKSDGWVKSIDKARLFVTFPDLGPRSVSKLIDGSRISVHEYVGPVGKDNVIRATKRPQRNKNKSYSTWGSVVYNTAFVILSYNPTSPFNFGVYFFHDGVNLHVGERSVMGLKDQSKSEWGFAVFGKFIKERGANPELSSILI